MSIRHEFYESANPQGPILLNLGVEYEVLRTTVVREASGRGPCADDPVVIRHYVRSTTDLAADKVAAEEAEEAELEELARIASPYPE